jgi:hypothetical protein
VLTFVVRHDGSESLFFPSLLINGGEVALTSVPTHMRIDEEDGAGKDGADCKILPFKKLFLEKMNARMASGRKVSIKSLLESIIFLEISRLCTCSIIQRKTPSSLTIVLKTAVSQNNIFTSEIVNQKNQLIEKNSPFDTEA